MLVLLLTPCTARGDDTELGVTGGTITAERAGDIRLDAETVQSVCFGTFAEYRVDFRFVNEGAPRVVRLGFPFSAVADGEHGTNRPFGFQAWQGRRALPVHVVGAAGYASGRATAGYFVHRARFPHGSTMITVSYLSERSATARGRVGNDLKAGMAGWYEYWLHTGATWKGPIGTAVVRYSLADTFRGTGMALPATRAAKGVPVTTAGWAAPLPRTYQWRFRDFEPTAARGSAWWKPQLGSDVFLGFAVKWRPGAQPRWTQSGDAGGSRPSVGGGISDGLVPAAWAAKWPASAGRPWTQATFRRPVHLRELRIVAGDNDYVNAFRKYARPRTLTAAFSDGSTAALRLRDAAVLQRFPVDVTTGSVRLTVNSVYPGTDYPAVALTAVEFGRARAPGYARFADLLRTDEATGQQPAWAGPTTAGPTASPRFQEYQEQTDSMRVTGGTLIGIDDADQFDSTRAPYRRPATPGAITACNAGVKLPPPSLVGEPTSVAALSKWTFDLRYPSGVELIVNAKAPRRPTVVQELARQKAWQGEYEDGRRLPFEVTTIGNAVVGSARAGTITADWTGDVAIDVPAQVFWRDRDVAYHLYAGSRDVSLGDLQTIARAMIVPASGAAAAPVAVAEPRTAHPWWGAVVFVGALIALAVVMARRRTA